METRLLEPISFYLNEKGESFTMPFHSHTYFEFMYCIKGRFIFEYIDKNNYIQEIEVHENEMIFVSSNLKHRLCIPKKEASYIGNIEYSLINKAYSEVQKTINYSSYFVDILLKEMESDTGCLVIKDQFQIQNNLVKIINLLNDQYIADDTDMAISNMNFFYSISKSLMKKKEGKYGFIRNSIEYINENYYSNITVKQLADMQDINPSYFAHKFKEDRGISVLKYINTLRINRACYLLNNTSLPISEIAEKVGYKDNDELNYQFKNIMNTSPRKYKQGHNYQQIDDKMIGNYHSIDYRNIK